MNCQDFESNLDGLARGALMDAREREAALGHEAACARCAARLADERALTAGLRALASEMKEAEPAARVESALLAALRARAGSVVVAEGGGRADSTQVSPHGAARQTPYHDDGQVALKNFSWAKALAVASLAAAAAVAFFMLIPPNMSLPWRANRSVAATQDAKGTQNSAQTDNTTSNIDVASGTSTGENGPGEKQEEAKVDEGPVAPPSPQRRLTNVPRTTPAIFEKNNARGVAPSRGGGAGADGSGAEEIATDFIPLMPGGQFSQGEGAHLVRVELPRYALERFGLPVNAEQAGGRVKADVLLGDDGVARAIRFVR